MEKFTIGVIISTYNQPRWLEKTLWGYVYQTMPPSEIIIADDGSDSKTAEVIESFARKLPIRHVWQEHNGFGKSGILNKATSAATADYLIFSDQDCIPRADFVETHYNMARTGQYLSGGAVRLTRDVSEALREEDIKSGNAFGIRWLNRKGQRRTLKLAKLIGGRFGRIMNILTTARSTWNGCNSSGWRKDMIDVNGHNEEMHYGGQDREFGYRLRNLGITAKQVRYSAIVIHLDHDRPYKTQESIEKNKAIMQKTRREKRVTTAHGIVKREK